MYVAYFCDDIICNKFALLGKAKCSCPLKCAGEYNLLETSHNDILTLFDYITTWPPREKKHFGAFCIEIMYMIHLHRQ